MRRSTALSILLLVLPLWIAPAQAQDVHDLNGTWIVTSWASPEGEVNDEPQRGLFLFTIIRDDGGSYSMMFVPGTEPRAEYASEQMTDAETLAAYGSFVANSGRLTVDGGSLTYEAYMAKDPNYMASWEDNSATADWTVEGGTLTLEFTSGFLTGSTATFRRPRAD